jgi:hypothetical protein
MSKRRTKWSWPDVRSILAVGVVSGVFVAAFMGIEQQMFIALLPLGTMVLGWYFGSSKSSSDKDTTISGVISKESDERKEATKSDERREIAESGRQSAADAGRIT